MATARTRTGITAIFVVGLLAAAPTFATPAASATNCDNEENILAGGDDFAIDVGPGVLLVGFDKGDTYQDEPVDGGHRVFVCTASDTVGFHIRGSVDRRDLPTAEDNGRCGVNVLGGSCEIPGFRIVAGDSGSNDTVRLKRSGLPAGNGSTEVSVPPICVVEVGGNC